MDGSKLATYQRTAGGLWGSRHSAGLRRPVALVLGATLMRRLPAGALLLGLLLPHLGQQSPLPLEESMQVGNLLPECGLLAQHLVPDEPD